MIMLKNTPISIKVQMFVMVIIFQKMEYVCVIDLIGKYHNIHEKH